MQQMITGKTKVVAILADPIAHVQTPRLMNQLFQQANYDAVCVPFQVAPEQLADVLNSMRQIQSIAGAVVTVPHKMPVCQLCDDTGPQAQVMQAVNAVHFKGDNRAITGEMFDGMGFVQGLKNNGVVVNAQLKVYLAGAGGVARGVAFALLGSGVRHIQLYNRTADKAEALQTQLQDFMPEAQITLATDKPAGVDLCINATSQGMLGLEDQQAFVLDHMDSNACVAEVVMQPKQTQLLQRANEKGMKIVLGEAMFLAQVAQLAAYVLNEPDLARVQLQL